MNAAPMGMTTRTKNNSAEAPYITPMRLWSTVVSQLRQPVVACGRVKTPSGRAVTAAPGVSSRGAVGRSTIAISIGLLLQRLEERNQLVDLFLRQVQVGHASALRASLDLLGRGRVHRLLARGVAQPRLEVGAVDLAAVVGADLVGLDDLVAVLVDPQVEDRAGEGAAAHEVGEVGGVAGHQVVALAGLLPGVVVDAPGQVAGGALAGEQFGAVGGVAGRGLVGVGLLVIEPGLEVVGLERHHPLAHITVRQPAVLGALAHVGPGIVGVEGEWVRAPRHSVLLAVERRDPERVDDVVGPDLEADVPPGGDHEIVGREHVLVVETVAVGVVGVLPPPLLACDLDGERLVVGLVDVEQGGQRHDADPAEQQRGQDRPPDLELGVAVCLRGQLVGVLLLALAELHHQEEHAELDQHEHHGGDDEDGVDEVVDLAVERRMRTAEAHLATTSMATAWAGPRAPSPGAGSWPLSSPSSWISRWPATAAPMPAPINPTAATRSTPTMRLALTRGREAKKKPSTTIMAARPTPIHTATSDGTARNTREKATTTTAIASNPAAGNSTGL